MHVKSLVATAASSVFLPNSCVYIYILFTGRLKITALVKKEYASKKKFTKSGDVFCSLPILCEGMTQVWWMQTTAGVNTIIIRDGFGTCSCCPPSSQYHN